MVNYLIPCVCKRPKKCLTCFILLTMTLRLFRYVQFNSESSRHHVLLWACDNAAKGKLQNMTDAPFAVQFKIQNADLISVKTQNSYSLFSSLSMFFIFEF